MECILHSVYSWTFDKCVLFCGSAVIFHIFFNSFLAHARIFGKKEREIFMGFGNLMPHILLSWIVLVFLSLVDLTFEDLLRKVKLLFSVILTLCVSLPPQKPMSLQNVATHTKGLCCLASKLCLMEQKMERSVVWKQIQRQFDGQISCASEKLGLEAGPPFDYWVNPIIM